MKTASWARADSGISASSACEFDRILYESGLVKVSAFRARFHSGRVFIISSGVKAGKQ